MHSDLEIGLCDQHDLENLLDLAARLLTEQNRATIMNFLVWKYWSNPDCENSLIVQARVRGRVVGMRGFMGQRWSIGAAGTISIPLAGDTVIAREHEGRGLQRLMNRVAAHECRRRSNLFMMNLSAGQTVNLQSRRAGWRLIAPTIELKRSPGLRSEGHRSFKTIRGAEPSGLTVTLDRVVSDDALRALVAAAPANRRPIAPVQNVEYWKWRLRCPISHYWFLTARARGDVLGIMVLARAWYYQDVIYAAHWLVRDDAIFCCLLKAAPEAFPDAEVVLWENSLDASERECAKSLGFDKEAAPPGKQCPFKPGMLLVSTQDSPNDSYVCEGVDLLNGRNWQYYMLNSDAL